MAIIDLPEEHNICEALFKDIVKLPEAAGLMMRGGTIVDVTVISAPNSKICSVVLKNPSFKRLQDIINLCHIFLMTAHLIIYIKQFTKAFKVISFNCFPYRDHCLFCFSQVSRP